MNYILPRIINTQSEYVAAEAMCVVPEGVKAAVRRKIKLKQGRVELIFKRTRCAEAQNWKCCYCGCEMNTNDLGPSSVTLEHVVPRSLGGTDEMDNLVAACSKCNQARGNSPLDENYQIIGIIQPRIKIEVSPQEKQLREYKFSLDSFIFTNPSITRFDKWISKVKIDNEQMKKDFIEEARMKYKLHKESSHLHLKKIIWKKEATLQQLREAEKTIRRNNMIPFTYPKVFEDDVWVTVIKKEEKK